MKSLHVVALLLQEFQSNLFKKSTFSLMLNDVFSSGTGLTFIKVSSTCVCIQDFDDLLFHESCSLIWFEEEYGVSCDDVGSRGRGLVGLTVFEGNDLRNPSLGRDMNDHFEGSLGNYFSVSFSCQRLTKNVNVG